MTQTPRSQVKGKQQTPLFSNGGSYIPSQHTGIPIFGITMLLLIGQARPGPSDSACFQDLRQHHVIILHWPGTIRISDSTRQMPGWLLLAWQTLISQKRVSQFRKSLQWELDFHDFRETSLVLFFPPNVPFLNLPPIPYPNLTLSVLLITKKFLDHCFLYPLP